MRMRLFKEFKMSAVLTCFLMIGLLCLTSSGGPIGIATTPVQASRQESQAGSPKTDQATGVSEFDRLRIEGFTAVYNIDYKTARDRFLQMTRLAPDHPAGYVYLANNVWLETLYQSRRL